jgi:hypothetical protein
MRIALPLLAGTLAVVAATNLSAQRGRGGGRYDPSTVETITGTIARVDTMPSPRGLGGGLHVQLKAGAVTYDVHLGPREWLAGKALTLAVGDEVKVNGSVITYEGGKAVLAATITRGTVSVQMRDSTGVPLWARARGGVRR